MEQFRAYFFCVSDGEKEQEKVNQREKSAGKISNGETVPCLFCVRDETMDSRKKGKKRKRKNRARRLLDMQINQYPSVAVLMILWYVFIVWE